jgi:DNA-binding beta-propeller fold protein YncE
MTQMVSRQHAYRADLGWAKLPPNWRIGDVGGVGVDSQDRVYVFNRSEHPMLVFDAEGNFLRSWGEQLFTHPHGVHVGPDDFIYCTDDGDHTVRKCTLGGEVVLEIGVPGQFSVAMSGLPFNRCTHTALSPEGCIYVSDGYGNAHIHKYSPEGKWLLSWGGVGSAPGQFRTPHNICCDSDGWVYVADRENHRIQVFDGDGKMEAQWYGFHRPCALCMRCSGDAALYVGEVAPALPTNLQSAEKGPRITVLNLSGEPLARIGERGPGMGIDQFMAPHGMAVSSRGDIYVGEVSRAAWAQFYPGEHPPDELRSLRKLLNLRQRSVGPPASGPGV